MAIAATWVKLDHVDKIEEGVTSFRRKRKNIAVLKKAGKIIKVFQDNCPHNRRIMISDGYILDDETNVTITCQFHGACFKLEDGKIIRGPGKDDLHLYPFRITEKNLLECQLDDL